MPRSSTQTGSRATTLAGARQQYALGNNVGNWLRQELGADAAHDMVEISYDLQAGSYTSFRRDHALATDLLAGEAAALLDESLVAGDQVLDAGCGEATTLCDIASKLVTPCRFVGLDLSWSRIQWARRNALTRAMPSVEACDLVVGTMAALPLAPRSVDVVVTSHSLEPNRGSEAALLQELFRVARRKVMLFEPCYERVDSTIRSRMDSHGYVTSLEERAYTAGGTVRRVVQLEHSVNPLNPTFLFEIDLDQDGCRPGQEQRAEWCCPATFEQLADHGDCWIASRVGLAYPSIGGIPVLRADKAVVATQFDPADNHPE